jgi:IMP dehydrogenase
MDLKFLDANLVPYVPKQFLTFDDVQIMPRRSNFDSRNDSKIDISTQLSPLIKIPTPIISSPMDCVTESDMAIAMHKVGGFGIIHRFYQKYGDQAKLTWINDVNKIIQECKTPGISIGAHPDDLNLVKEVFEMGAKGLVVAVDVAHGHLDKALKQYQRLRELYQGQVQIMSGSICTPHAALDCVKSGCDILRVGVGCGSACTTRIQTGHGIPQLTAIMQIRRALHGMQRNVTLVADGGIRNSGDIAKALAAGADAVMLGRLLASAKESSAKVLDSDFGSVKLYRGQASHAFMKEMQINRNGSEGESFHLDYNKETVFKIISTLVDGLKSSMSYAGCYNLEDFANNTNFIQITPAGYLEGTAS